VLLKPNKLTYPDPPDGYQAAVRFQYPMLRLQFVAMFGLVLSAGLFRWVGRLLNSSFDIFSPSSTSGIAEIGMVLLAVLVTIVVHEWVHGLVYRVLGYHVSYGLSWRMGAAYAAAFGQWQKRDHNLLAALAPLVVLTPLFIGLLATPNQLLNLAAFSALIFNTSGAVGDLYLSWRLVRLPKGALLYDIDPKTMLIYLPK
jgi:hypothetical protein